MSLAQMCRHEFPTGVRNKGTKYFENGRVRIDRWGSEGLTATVRGTARYDVYLSWGDHTDRYLDAFCSCPFFESNSFCKHLWAAVLEADARGLTAAIPPRGKFFLYDVDYPDDSQIGELIAEAPRGTDLPERREGSTSAGSARRSRSGTAVASPKARKTAKSKKPRAPKPPAWTQRFQQVVAVNAERVEKDEVSPSYGRPKAKEAWFVLNLSLSSRTGTPVIDVHQREQRKTGGYGKIKSLNFTVSEVGVFPNPEDREALRQLWRGRSQESVSSGYSSAYYGYYSYYNPRQSQFAVSSDYYDRVFASLAATGVSSGFLRRTRRSPPRRRASHGMAQRHGSSGSAFVRTTRRSAGGSAASCSRGTKAFRSKV